MDLGGRVDCTSAAHLQIFSVSRQRWAAVLYLLPIVHPRTLLAGVLPCQRLQGIVAGGAWGERKSCVGGGGGGGGGKWEGGGGRGVGGGDWGEWEGRGVGGWKGGGKVLGPCCRQAREPEWWIVRLEESYGSENRESSKTWKYGGAELGGRFSCFTFNSGDLSGIELSCQRSDHQGYLRLEACKAEGGNWKAVLNITICLLQVLNTQNCRDWTFGENSECKLLREGIYWHSFVSCMVERFPGDFFGRPVLTLLEVWVSMCLFRSPLCVFT